MYELEINRQIAAPPETVYRAWTERLREWWALHPEWHSKHEVPND